MKEVWLRASELVDKYNLPTTVQGIIHRAKVENWKKRKAKGAKGGTYEFEVSDIINTTYFNSLQKKIPLTVNVVIMMR